LYAYKTRQKIKNKIKSRAPVAREEKANLDFGGHFGSTRTRSRAWAVEKAVENLCMNCGRNS
jgi:hypothetical protein